MRGIKDTNSRIREVLLVVLEPRCYLFPQSPISPPPSHRFLFIECLVQLEWLGGFFDWLPLMNYPFICNILHFLQFFLYFWAFSKAQVPCRKENSVHMNPSQGRSAQSSNLKYFLLEFNYEELELFRQVVTIIWVDHDCRSQC